MSELTQEQYDQLPEFAKNAFAQDGDKWIPAKDATLKNTLDELNKKYRDAESGQKTLKRELDEYRAQEKERAAEAEAAALEKLKKEGKIDEVLADQKKRHDETLKQYEERMTKMRDAMARSARKAIAAEIAQNGTNKGRALLERTVMDRIQYDPEQDKYTFLDESGSATSLDLEGFKQDVLKSEMLSPLIKAPMSGGGDGDGGMHRNGSADVRKITRAAFDQLGHEQRREFAKTGGIVTD